MLNELMAWKQQVEVAGVSTTGGDTGVENPEVDPVRDCDMRDDIGGCDGPAA